MQIRFGNRTLHGPDGESVLECLERHGEKIASFCRSGACQSCVLRADSGTVPAVAQQGLKDSWKQQGRFLACMCRPTGEMQVSRCDAGQSHAVHVVGVDRLSSSIARVSLSRPEELDYSAGQFIQLIRTSDELMRPYSLASLPREQLLELHVALLPQGRMSPWLVGAVGNTLSIRGPFGDCVYLDHEPDRPLILAGTGTGLAPLLGVVRAAVTAGHRGTIRLFHGATRFEDLYQWRELTQLQREHPRLQVVGSVPGGGNAGAPHAEGGPAISERPLTELLMSEGSDLAQGRVYLCGNAEFVRKLRRQIYLAGTPLARIHSDAFLPMAQPAG